MKVWLGGLFNPEAYITATRQYVAQANSWSLEELSLVVEIEDSQKGSSSTDERSFGITGLKLQGAKSLKNKLFLDMTILTELPLVNIRWLKLKDASSKPSNKVGFSIVPYMKSNCFPETGHFARLPEWQSIAAAVHD